MRGIRYKIDIINVVLPLNIGCIWSFIYIQLMFLLKLSMIENARRSLSTSGLG